MSDAGPECLTDVTTGEETGRNLAQFTDVHPEVRDTPPGPPHQAYS